MVLPTRSKDCVDSHLISKRQTPHTRGIGPGLPSPLSANANVSALSWNQLLDAPGISVTERGILVRELSPPASIPMKLPRFVQCQLFFTVKYNWHSTPFQQREVGFRIEAMNDNLKAKPETKTEPRRYDEAFGCRRWRWPSVRAENCVKWPGSWASVSSSSMSGGGKSILNGRCPGPA